MSPSSRMISPTSSACPTRTSSYMAAPAMRVAVTTAGTRHRHPDTVTPHPDPPTTPPAASVSPTWSPPRVLPHPRLLPPTPDPIFGGQKGHRCPRVPAGGTGPRDAVDGAQQTLPLGLRQPRPPGPLHGVPRRPRHHRCYMGPVAVVGVGGNRPGPVTPRVGAVYSQQRPRPRPLLSLLSPPLRQPHPGVPHAGTHRHAPASAPLRVTVTHSLPHCHHHIPVPFSTREGTWHPPIPYPHLLGCAHPPVSPTTPILGSPPQRFRHWGGDGGPQGGSGGPRGVLGGSVCPRGVPGGGHTPAAAPREAPRSIFGSQRRKTAAEAIPEPPSPPSTSPKRHLPPDRGDSRTGAPCGEPGRGGLAPPGAAPPFPAPSPEPGKRQPPSAPTPGPRPKEKTKTFI